MTAKLASRQPKPASTNVLVLRCDECEKRVKRDGYIKVDREAIARNAVMVGDWEVIDPSNDRVYWKILHADCDPAPKATDRAMLGDCRLASIGWVARPRSVSRRNGVVSGAGV